MKYIAIDTETSGLDINKHQLLTAAFLIYDEQELFIDELNLTIGCGGEYNVSTQALEVNGIDLIEHSNMADPLKTCQNKLKHFLKKHTHSVKSIKTFNFNLSSPVTDVQYDVEHLIPVGCGVSGDLKWIGKQLLPTWKQYISYVYRDPTVFAAGLHDAGKLGEPKFGLASLAKHFGIKYQPHNAREDAIASMKVYFQLLGVARCNS